MNKISFNTILGILSTLMYMPSLYAGCQTLMDLANSPNYMDSPCTAHFKQEILELNYYNLRLVNPAGVQQSYPNAQLRIGLPIHNEFFIFLPSYIQQTSAPRIGSAASVFGLKHLAVSNETWALAVEEALIPPGGSYYYGSAKWGGLINGIFSYNMTEHINISGVLGVSNVSESAAAGGGSFASVNPVLDLIYTVNQRFSFYGELFGQSKIGLGEGAGLNFDAGVLFLYSPAILLNMSAGQQLYQDLGNFKHYFSLGVVLGTQ